MQVPEIPGVVDALDVVADADLSDDDDWSDEEDEEEEEDEVLRDNFKPLHYQETSMESWNNSASGSRGKDELMKALQVYRTKARAHVVLMPALLVTIVGFLGSLRQNSHLLAIYVVAVTLFVLLPFAIPVLCIGPETTIKHVRAAPRAVGVLGQGMGAILAAPSTTKCCQGPCNK
ncbi:uncharacterized protein LOC142817495 [Rhipicephalus microplus]|uniref:uncharacterized protein LOC142817495 n=1 Tax=Rhipicephalus microplus TaxID=6941 RepID=UPI003F6D15AE